MTQYLLEEAGLLLLDVVEARAENDAMAEMSEAHEDQARAARLRSMAEKALGR